MKIQQITDNVHVVTGTNVNWALITDGNDVTVIDAGYPNDSKALLQSIHAIGRSAQDVQAIVVTHAHLDHIGGIPKLLAQKVVPVLTGAAEVPHAHREYLEQITPKQMAQQCTHHQGRVWVAQTVKACVPHLKMSIPQAQAVADGIALDIPGHLTPIATPGHTSGHTAYLMESAGILFSGDAIVTDHPLLTGPPHPQPLPSFFSEDDALVDASIALLAQQPADILIPGHGPVMNGSIADLIRNGR